MIVNRYRAEVLLKLLREGSPIDSVGIRWWRLITLTDAVSVRLGAGLPNVWEHVHREDYSEAHAELARTLVEMAEQRPSDASWIMDSIGYLPPPP